MTQDHQYLRETGSAKPKDLGLKRREKVGRAIAWASLQGLRADCPWAEPSQEMFCCFIWARVVFKKEQEGQGEERRPDSQCFQKGCVPPLVPDPIPFMQPCSCLALHLSLPPLNALLYR